MFVFSEGENAVSRCERTSNSLSVGDYLAADQYFQTLKKVSCISTCNLDYFACCPSNSRRKHCCLC